MRRHTPKISRARWAIAAIAAVVIIFSWWQVLATGRGLVVRDMTGAGGTPLRYIAPEGAASAPAVVVAHGFAGSKQLMYGFGYAFARAGYGVMLLDFDGQGESRVPLERTGSALQDNLDAAYAALIAQPEIDPARIAILGHSMGSGAAMTAAINTPERYRATVAVSPTGAAVSPELPPNLLLMAGSLEPQFLGNAQELLATAGGQSDDLPGGRGRALVEVPRVEHITILFSRTAHAAALDWLDRVFEQPKSNPTPDWRLVLLGMSLVGWLVLALAASPLWLNAAGLSANNYRRSDLWVWLGLPAGALAAAAILFLAGRAFDVSRLGGLLVGGALGLWFLVLGVVWLVAGFRVPRPSGADVAWGGLLFMFLSLAFGAMSQVTWLPWIITPERLLRWPVLAAATLPWLLAAALAYYRATLWRRAGWWLFHSAVIVAGLGITVLLSPDLFFIFLLLPVFPIILGILAATSVALDRPWAAAVGGALFIGWILVAVFPMA